MNNLLKLIQNLTNTYQSVLGYLYQNINQSTYTNNNLSSIVINYSLLLPASEFITNLNTQQVNAQIQAYVTQCNNVINYIDDTVLTQTNIQIEQIQSTIVNSIAALNNYGKILLLAQSNNQFTYTVPYDMGLSEAIFLNNLNNYQLQAVLNYNINDFNYIPQGTLLTFARS